MKNKLNKYTVSELTNYQYRELVYDSASSTQLQFDFLSEICRLLSLAVPSESGSTEFISERTVFDEELSQKIGIFQEIAKIDVTGILNDTTLKTLVLYVENNFNDEVTDDDSSEEKTQKDENIKNDSPHFNSFFGEDKYKMHRRNRQNIEIVFGRGSIKKTIVDVFIRSVSVEVDTSGNPISEVYEFIARDIKESDELSDYDKYDGIATAPSDIQYPKYDFSEYVGN